MLKSIILTMIALLINIEMGEAHSPIARPYRPYRSYKTPSMAKNKPSVIPKTENRTSFWPFMMLPLIANHNHPKANSTPKYNLTSQ